VEFLNRLIHLDLAKLYYSDWLIFFIVSISFLIIIFSFSYFTYLLFIKKYKNVDRESYYNTYRKHKILAGAICAISCLFITTVFPFAHVWNQLVSRLFFGLN
jgi:ABC-type spermidine/putrescine transport system permease subunit I